MLNTELSFCGLNVICQLIVIIIIIILSRCDNLMKLQSRLDYLRSLLNDPTSFKNIYRYAFDFARVCTSTCMYSENSLQRHKFVFGNFVAITSQQI